MKGQKRGWAGFGSAGWPWLVKWVSTHASPPYVNPVWCCLELTLRCLFIYPLIHFFHYSTSIWCLSVYWTWNLMNTVTGGDKVPLPAVLLADVQARVYAIQAVISLPWVCFLFCKVRIVPSLQITEWLWSSNETMYAQMLSKSKELS